MRNLKDIKSTKWNSGTISDIAEVVMGQSPPGSSYNMEGNGIGLINGPTEFTNKYPIVKQWTTKPTKLCKPGDILLCVRGSSTGRMNISDSIYCIGRGVASISGKVGKGVTEFLYYLLDFKIDQLLRKTAGSTFPNLSSNEIKGLNISIPPIDEQLKISSILSVWDKEIKLKEKLIEQKKEQKKGLMQKLLTGKIRVPGRGGKVNKIKLKGLIKEINERNTKNSISNVLSVTNSNGFILQSEQFGRQIASKDLSNYKIVRKGQFAYNPSRVNVGSIDLLKKFDVGILSPMYVIFETFEEKLLPNYLYHFLKSNLFLNQLDGLLQGSVRQSLNFKSLEQVKLFVPDLNEQREISELLNKFDEQLRLLQLELDNLQEQKKGLMQILLTGKVHVNV